MQNRLNIHKLVQWLVALAFAFAPSAAWAAGATDQDLVASVGISILAATVLAYLGFLTRQPLLLAYIAAGMVIGPKVGFGFVHSESDIQVISEIGLVLLLFMIGLEIDIKKLRESGRALIVTGVLQFVLCVAMGIGFFLLLGYPLGWGKFDLFYLSVCCAISSTTIVVKLLYEKDEMDTLAGRITVGVLVFQDIWAILVLGVQPNLAEPQVGLIALSLVKGLLLVAVSLLISRYVLGALFRSIAKLPELVLVASLGWCFLVAGAAARIGLSPEMGALIAGAAISTFPYNLDVISKMVSIRDFFITLFFVALGMEIPNPVHHPGLLGVAAVTAAFLMASRFLAVFPLLSALRMGHRVSLLVPINLAQMSEFALVIAALGLASGHVGEDVLTVIIFTFTITSLTSSYLIKFSHPVQEWMTRALVRVGIADIANVPVNESFSVQKEIALLGFHRVASSLVEEIQHHDQEIRDKLVVVDLNPDVHQHLQTLGIKVVYGDISHMETLHHAGIHEAKVVISTIPDTFLKGTDNLRLIQQIQRLCPHAKIIVTAESAKRALEMYQEGADYVFLPRIVSANHLIPVVEGLLEGRMQDLKKLDVLALKQRHEIVS
jgi:Kef-type K+ transport system membrane component KefB/Trk K+ transport system NAD-binding subunit